MNAYKHLPAFLICVNFGWLAGLTYAQPNYTEDFTSTSYQDQFNTTADWNTGEGLLKLVPFTPRLTGAFNTAGDAYDVTVAGNRAYVADSVAGLQVIDISDRAAPVLAGTYATAGDARGV